MKKIVRYDLFVFLSSFARSLIEVFLPIFLLNRGFSLANIFLYFALKYFIFAFLTPFIIKIGNSFSYKKLLIWLPILFIFHYLLLWYLPVDILSIFILSFVGAIYLNTYWLPRHIYALDALPKERLALKVGFFLNLNNLALFTAGLIGAFLFENLSFALYLFVALIIMFLSLLPLINFQDIPKRRLRIHKALPKIIKSIPKKDLMVLILDQFKFIVILLFPLYTYLFVSESFYFVGTINFIIGLASFIFIALFSKIMDQKKNDYLLLSTSLLALIWITKLTISIPLLMIFIVIAEGFVTKMHELSMTRNIYALGKHYDSASYILFVEVFQNVVKGFIFILALLLKDNLIVFLGICSLIFIISGFIPFDDGKGGY